MISSMTGFGRSEASENNITVTVEIRTVNSRFLEVTSRLPRTLALKENEVKEIVRQSLVRGKVNIVITTTRQNDNDIPVKINEAAAVAYFKLLTSLRKAVKIQEKVSLDHLLKFPEVLEVDSIEETDDQEWILSERALRGALVDTQQMRIKEGRELGKDLSGRVREIERVLSEIEQMAKERLPQERERLEERLRELVADQNVIDKQRLELELALFADKLDVTEECVRFRSHNKFFLEALNNGEAAGRKLNFLVQEMNREANTIGSKASSAEIAHKVVFIKEELEKIREQLQNIE